MSGELARVLSDAIRETSDIHMEALRELATMLAAELDRQRADLNELRQHVTGLQERVKELER